MSTRADIRGEVQSRLGDAAAAVWTTAELNGIIDFAVKGLYPTFFERKVASTVATEGPIQTGPSGARNLYFIGHKRLTSTRVRQLRGWNEGSGDAYVPRTGITGDTLVWAWTAGWNAPPDDITVLTLPTEAEEVLVLRGCVSALEDLLVDRLRAEKYHAIQVREGNSEQDIDLLIQNFRDSIEERVRNTLPLPEVQK